VNKITQSYRLRNGQTLNVKSLDILVDREINHNVKFFEHVLKAGAWRGGFAGLGVLLLVLFGWAFRGKRQQRTKHIRGAMIVPAWRLRRKLKWSFKASKFEIAGVPFVKHTENEHILFSGSTGIGKTTAMNQLLQQIRKKGQKAVIVDTTGNFVENFYRAEHDIILNPFDKRCNPWSFWAECTEEPHYEQVVEAAIPSSQTDNPFWTEASRVVVAELLREMKQLGITSNKELARHLFYDRVSELKEFLKKTCAARFTEEEAEKMSYGVLANFIAPLQLLRYLPDASNPFSIREWVKRSGDDRWLFLTCKKDHLKLMRPMLSLWLDSAKNALLSMGEVYPPRNLWFVFDELPALKKLEGLSTIMTEGRKYGACVTAGFQSIASLRKHYGNDGCVELLDNFNTKILFRSGEPETAKYISDMLGEEEIMETQEQVSVGVHEVRGSTTFNVIRRLRPIALPTEIQNLDKFRGFLKLPGKLPIGKIILNRKDMPKIAEAFSPASSKDLVLGHTQFAKELKEKHDGSDENEFPVDKLDEDNAEVKTIAPT